MPDEIPSITVTENGPYVVSGALPIHKESIDADSTGSAWAWKEGMSIEAGDGYALCRCGHSSTKPFCDGTHNKVGFDGTETAARSPFAEEAQTIEGPTMDLADDEPLCSLARFCDGAGGIWDAVGQTDDADKREQVAGQGARCPSGRLVVTDKEHGETVEPDFELSIVLVEDPQQQAGGPLWVRGGVQVTAADGHEYELRNRVTLCRCGESQNKPFCDGTHVRVGWQAQ